MRLGGATEEEIISSPFHATQGNILNRPFARKSKGI